MRFAQFFGAPMFRGLLINLSARRGGLLACALLAMLTSFGVSAMPARAQLTTLKLKQWSVPFERSRLRDAVAQSEQTVWFAGVEGGYIAKFDKAAQSFDRVSVQDARPHNILIGRRGDIWFTANGAARLGRYAPASAKLEHFTINDPRAIDPHSLTFDAAEENIWFSVQGGNFVGRFNIASQRFDLVRPHTQRARPNGIKVAPDGTIWVALFGTNRLAQIDPKTLQLSEVALPRPAARPRRLTITNDGLVWYGDYATGRLGSYNPQTKRFREYVLPQGRRAQPYGIAKDKAGRIFVAATGASPVQIIGFNPVRERFFASAVLPSNSGAVRDLSYFAGSNSLWFASDANAIGVVSLPAAP